MTEFCTIGFAGAQALCLMLVAASNVFAQTPVLVELFTSEGCSSCPPADTVLADLQAKQPVKGAEIIVLSEHVDYWDHLGWKDPFSAAQFSRRQEWFAASLGERGVYTPQMVVDGRMGFVGSDGREAKRAITQAAAESKVALRLTVHDGYAEIEVPEGARLTKNAELWLAVAENNLRSSVARGENGGRQLPHTGVVRQLKPLGKVSRARVGIDLQPQWKRADLRAVAFLQDPSSRRILGAAISPVE